LLDLALNIFRLASTTHMQTERAISQRIRGKLHRRNIRRLRTDDDGVTKNADIVRTGVDPYACADALSRSPLLRENVKMRRFSR
jgi:hypothetical protein